MKEAVTLNKKEFDYYIFLDYSESLVGYSIIEKRNLSLILPKIIKFRHYKEERHKKTYLLKIKREIKNTGLESLLLKQKIKHINDNLVLFADIIEFIKLYDNCLIFISLDNNQFNAFTRLLDMVPHRQNIVVRNESELRKKSIEYRLSLIIDTMLNIERRDRMSK